MTVNLPEGLKPWEMERYLRNHPDVLHEIIGTAEEFFGENTHPDIEHWSKAAYWKPDEATALSFGMEPQVVNWGRLEGYIHEIPFAEHYARRRELVMRAIEAGQLPRVGQTNDGVAPDAFVEWANHLGMCLSRELEEKVRAVSQTVDWKALCEEKERQLEEAKAEIDRLQQQAERPLTEKERSTVLKLIIGMAMAGYGYYPKDSRSTTAREIAKDLRSRGLPIDEDTVRKWLQEAWQRFNSQIGEATKDR